MTELEKAVAWLEHWKMVKECDARSYPHRTEHAEAANHCRALLDALRKEPVEIVLDHEGLKARPLDALRWTPVSERMPTEDDADEKGNVLCFWTDGAIETYQARWVEEWNSDRNHKDKITHWRPLPPKPEGSE